MLLALALLACQQLLPDDTGSTSDTGTDTGPPLDTFEPGGDTDTGAPADTEADPVDEGPCPTHSGFGEVGSSRTFETTAGAGLQSRWTWTTTDSDASGHVTRTYDATHDHPSGQDSYTRAEYRYRCDDEGAWLIWSRSVGGFDAASESVSEITYSTPLRNMVHDPQPGESWSSSYAYTVDWTAANGQTSTTTVSQTLHFTVGQPRTVTVPAGTFDVLRFDTSVVVDGTAYPSWFDAAPGVGMVQAETARLLSWSGD